MGTNTTLRSLYKPSVGETGWGDSVNENFNKLDGPQITVIWGNNTPNNLTNNVDNYHSYTTEVIDDLNLWSSTTSTITIASSGLYRVRANLLGLATFSGGFITQGRVGLNLLVNGNTDRGDNENLYGPPNDSDSMFFMLADELLQQLVPGDTIRTDVYPHITVSGASIELSATSFLTIEKIR